MRTNTLYQTKMSKKGDSTSFWVGYGDLMTSLFFVMLILFVVCLSHHLSRPIVSAVEFARLRQELKNKTKELERKTIALDEAMTTKRQLERILQIDEQFKGLETSSELYYDAEKKVFVAKDFIGIEIFDAHTATIKPEYHSAVARVGFALQGLLKELYQQNPELRFLLVIEGNAAIPWRLLKSQTYNPDNEQMYHLSYDRALALYMYWRRCGIDLRRYNTEIIIAGSGFNGINRDNNVEENNKRFMIQIVPKVSKSLK